MTAEAKDLPANISSKKTALSDAVAKCRFGQAQGLQDAIRRLEGQMRNQTSGDQAFIDSFQTYARDIAKYIQFLCIAIRLPRTPEFEDDGIDMCNWLIQFLKKIGKKAQCSQVYDMFVDMHLRFQNGTEQGNALLQYADFLSWDSTKDRHKIFSLLQSAHDVFKASNSLAQCVQVCKRLAVAHELYSLKFMDVAKTLRLQGQYMETLSKKDQIAARYAKNYFLFLFWFGNVWKLICLCDYARGAGTTGYCSLGVACLRIFAAMHTYTGPGQLRL